MKAFIVPLVFYSMALMGICIEFLPESALAIFGGKVEGDTRTTTVIFVLVFGGLGALLHWLLYRRNPESFDSVLMAKAGIAMAVVMAGMFAVSAMLSISTGASPAELKSSTSMFLSTVGLVIMGSMVLLLIGAAVGIYLMLRFHPLNRMSRKMQTGNFSAAIAIGERAAKKPGNAAVRYNLALAYIADGQVQQGRAIYEELAAHHTAPEPFTSENFTESLALLREKLLDAENRG